MNIYSNIDLKNNQTIDGSLHKSSTPPTALVGKYYYNTTNNIPYYYNGTAWVEFGGSGGGSATIDVALPLYYDSSTLKVKPATVLQDGYMSKEDKELLDNATYENNISTLVRRDGNGEADFGQINITTIPTVGSNVVHLDYLNSRLLVMEPVLFASIGNLSLSGNNFIGLDTASNNPLLVNGVRVLACNQVNPIQNGIYIVNTSGAWTRSNDMSNNKRIGGHHIPVLSGTRYKGHLFAFTGTYPFDIVGVDTISFKSLVDGYARKVSGILSFVSGDGVNIPNPFNSLDVILEIYTVPTNIRLLGTRIIGTSVIFFDAINVTETQIRYVLIG